METDEPWDEAELAVMAASELASGMASSRSDLLEPGWGLGASCRLSSSGL